MKIDTETERKLVLMLPGLDALANKSLDNGIISGEARMCYDIWSYFIYQVIRCTNKGESLEISKRLLQYSVRLKEMEEFDTSLFFFVLLFVLQLRFEINLFSENQLTYDAFERSFAQNLEKYHLNKD